MTPSFCQCVSVKLKEQYLQMSKAAADIDPQES